MSDKLKPEKANRKDLVVLIDKQNLSAKEDEPVPARSAGRPRKQARPVGRPPKKDVDDVRTTRSAGRDQIPGKTTIVVETQGTTRLSKTKPVEKAAKAADAPRPRGRPPLNKGKDEKVVKSGSPDSKKDQQNGGEIHYIEEEESEESDEEPTDDQASDSTFEISSPATKRRRRRGNVVESGKRGRGRPRKTDGTKALENGDTNTGDDMEINKENPILETRKRGRPPLLNKSKNVTSNPGSDAIEDQSGNALNSGNEKRGRGRPRKLDKVKSVASNTDDDDRMSTDSPVGPSKDGVGNLASEDDVGPSLEKRGRGRPRKLDKIKSVSYNTDEDDKTSTNSSLKISKDNIVMIPCSEDGGGRFIEKRGRGRGRPRKLDKMKSGGSEDSNKVDADPPTLDDEPMFEKRGRGRPPKLNKIKSKDDVEAIPASASGSRKRGRPLLHGKGADFVLTEGVDTIEKPDEAKADTSLSVIPIDDDVSGDEIASDRSEYF